MDDPEDFLRGNHWDMEPEFPTTVEFTANVTSQTMTMTVPDDQRDLTDGDIIVNVLTSSDYLLGNTGQGTSAEVVVTDNDDAQELTFDWGYVDYEDSWGQGESWLYQQGSVWVSGPAEGLFYYNNDRTWRFDHGADEYFPIHFQVKRRSQDKGKTATFVVRVEHTRGWVHPRHSATDGWSTDPETGWRYKDYPITLEGNQQQVMGRIEILDNGLPDPEGWSYRASIRQIEDVNGVTLSADQEAKYWTVDGVRSRHSDPFDRGYPEVTLERVGPHMVDEGQTVEFEVERLQGNSLADLPVRVRTWEPNRRKDDGTNPTDQVHTVTLPAVAMTSDWTNYYGYGNLSQSVKFSVTITRDYEYEPLDFLKAEILPSPEDLHDSRDRTQYRIRDLDRPTITLSASPTSITEGEPVTFTLTRSVNTTEDLIVRVSIDDPGGFLEGNSPADAVTMPTNVAFAPGAVTMDIIVTPPDDWRDIPDSTLTFTVITEPEYNIEGSASATVQMADNDVAPQVGISFSHDVVEEGNDLILTITRTGEDKNPLRVPITAGPKGEQERVVVTLAAGESSQQVVFSRADDDRKTPDVEYEATLHAGQPEFWTTTGSTTINAIVNDDDLYRVGIEMLTPQVNEGQYIRYRVFHDGHTERSVETELRQSEEGSAVMDSAGGDFNRMLPAGASGSTVTVLAEARDGNDGDAVFTVVLLPGTGYTIDLAYASAQAIVRDADPLPVLGFRDLAVTVNEADGTVEFHVDLVSLLPSLRTVTVDYEVSEDRTDDGADLVGTTGTLTFAPGETSAAIEVTVVQDLIAEPNEGFTVSLSNPVYAELQDRQTSLRARGVILDDEPTVTLEVTDTTVDEGADVVVTLTRTGDTSRELTAWLRIVEQGSITYPAVTFSVGFGTATHTITTEDDHEALGTYDLNIGVAHPVNDIGETNTYHRSEGEVTITVRDDDLPTVWIETTDPDGSPGNGNPYPQVTIPRRIYEGDGMHFILKRQRRGPELTINLEGTGASSFITATLPTTVTMAQGETSARIHIPTYDDAVSEIHGEFTLTVKDGTGYRPGDPESADHWIYDDDTTGLPKLRISGEKDWVNEGEDVVFTLQRTGDTQASLEANLLIIKTKSNEQCMLDQTMRDRTVTITTEDDDRNRGDNTVVVAIGLGVYLIDDSTPNVDEDIVWIQDDDRTTVTLTPATDEFEEGTQMRVTLDRTGHPSPLLWVETMVEVTVLHPDSAKEQTFSFTAPFTRIDQGESSTTSQYGSARRVEALGATGRIWFEQKACIDSPGSVSAGGCGYGAQYLRGSQYEQDFTIYNPFMGVRIEADQTTVGEGNTATFTLHRHGGKTDSLTRTLQVRVQVTQEGDYISGSTPQTVTFAANQSAATLSVPTSQDSVDEADGSIKVKLLPPASRTDDQYAYEIGEYRGTPWTVTEVTSGVTDDDYVFPTMSVDDPTALESDGSIEFTVSLDRANYEEAVTVN